MMLTLLPILSPSLLRAQDDPRAEITMLYNSAQEEAQKGNFDKAIKMFKDADERSKAAGIMDISGLIAGQLPRIYSARAAAQYKAFQQSKTVANIDKSITAFKEAQQAGQTYGDANAAAQARNAIPQLIYAKSILQFNAEDYDAALASLDEAIALNANYATAYYQKGMVQRRLNPSNVLEIVKWFDEAIRVGQVTSVGNVVTNARNQAVETLIFNGVQAAEERNYNDAITYLTKATTYGTNSAEAYYRLAEVHNKRSNSAAAITNANKALEYESGGVADKAKIYFELGLAFQTQNKVDDACAAFKNAAYGQFRDNANYKMQFELKCPGMTGSR